MIAIDTNVLVRLLVRDDERQFSAVQRLLKHAAERNEPVFISLVAMVETEWVLRSRCKIKRAQIMEAFTALLESDDIQFEDEQALEQALHFWGAFSVSFTDCVLAARSRSAGCQQLVTFDIDAAKLPGVVRLDA